MIPEFYYLSEMFVNFNNYNLGVMDDGTVVSDVELPPWAKTSKNLFANRLVSWNHLTHPVLETFLDVFHVLVSIINPYSSEQLALIRIAEEVT